MKYLFNSEEHIHTLDGKPLMGTTTVCSVIAKPLTWWASGKAVEVMGWLNPKKSTLEDRRERAKSALETIKTLDVDSYLGLLQKAYCNHSETKDEAAEEGVDLHKEIEEFIIATKWGEEPKVSKRIEGFKKWADENVVEFIWVEGHCYSEKFWLGGISDFGYLDRNGKIWIGDIKSSKEAYYSQFVQLALYDLQISENGIVTSEGEIITKPGDVYGYAIFPFGASFNEPTIRIADESWKKSAIGAINLYKLQQQTQ